MVQSISLCKLTLSGILPSMEGRPGTILMDDHKPMNDSTLKHSYLCLPGMDNSYGRVWSSIPSSPSLFKKEVFNKIF